MDKWVLRHLKQFKFVYVFLLLCLIVGIRWLYQSQYYVSTDDAYIGANIESIAPQVTGAILKVYVKNHQAVRKGEPLFDIDPQPYTLALDKAQAELALREAELEATRLNTEQSLELVRTKALPAQAGDNAH